MIMEEDHEEEGRTAAEALHLVNCINFGGCLWNEVHWKAVGWGGMQVGREGGGRRGRDQAHVQPSKDHDDGGDGRDKTSWKADSGSEGGYVRGAVL